MSFSGWKDTSLGEIVNFRRGHDLPKSNMNPGIYPVVGSNGIIGYHDSYTTVEPCITIGRSGNVGNPHKINQKAWAHNTTLYIDDFKGNDPNFIFYLLKTLNLQHYKGGSAVPTLNRNHIHPIALRVPIDIQDQKAIAHILSTLDEKIEVNNKINKTLEEMAQAIFKHWFVDFEFPNEDGEPYKSSGGEMVNSELGPIPKGWEVGILGDIISISSGNRPNQRVSAQTSDFEIPLVGASSIMGYTNDYNYDEPILVIGRVGTHGVIQKFNERVWASDNTLVIKSKIYEYVYEILREIDYKSLNRGSTQPLITQTDIKTQKILLPEEVVSQKYEDLININSKLQSSNNSQNAKLIKIRDTLLPKLMSGEIRVPIENEQ